MSRHDWDWLSLLCGLIFVGLGVAYAAASMLELWISPLWALPGLLIALGVAGLIGTARSRRHGRDR